MQTQYLRRHEAVSGKAEGIYLLATKHVKGVFKTMNGFRDCELGTEENPVTAAIRGPMLVEPQFSRHV